jgi:hypothetical protein
MTKKKQKDLTCYLSPEITNNELNEAISSLTENSKQGDKITYTFAMPISLGQRYHDQTNKLVALINSINTLSTSLNNIADDKNIELDIKLEILVADTLQAKKEVPNYIQNSKKLAQECLEKWQDFSSDEDRRKYITEALLQLIFENNKQNDRSYGKLKSTEEIKQYIKPKEAHLSFSKDEDDLTKQITTLAQECLEANKRREAHNWIQERLYTIQDKLKLSFDIYYWDHWNNLLEQPQYKHHIARIDELLEKDPIFKGNFDHTLKSKEKSSSPKDTSQPSYHQCSKAYLRDECIKFSLWCEIYPQIAIMYPTDLNPALKNLRNRANTYITSHRSEFKPQKKTHKIINKAESKEADPQRNKMGNTASETNKNEELLTAIQAGIREEIKEQFKKEVRALILESRKNDKKHTDGSISSSSSDTNNNHSSPRADSSPETSPKKTKKIYVNANASSLTQKSLFSNITNNSTSSSLVSEQENGQLINYYPDLNTYPSAKLEGNNTAKSPATPNNTEHANGSYLCFPFSYFSNFLFGEEPNQSITPLETSKNMPNNSKN